MLRITFIVMENVYSERIRSLREVMRAKDWDAVVITGGDPHSSEYPAARWKQVEWLSGFTGEAGDIVVTLDHAGLWTDTRYFIQANTQLQGTGIVLHKTRVPGQILIPEWLSGQFGGEENVIVAVDGLCMDVSSVRRISAACGEQVEVVSVPDLLSGLWKDRPDIPRTPITALPEEVAGESRLARMSFLKGWIAEQGCSNMLLSSLDEIAWLLNIRGSDIEYNPYAISYAIIGPDRSRLFIIKDSYEALDPQTAATFSELESDGIEVLPYSDIDVALSSADCPGLCLDPSTLNYNLFTLCSDFKEVSSPIPLRKAVKTPVEIEGMKKAHLLDGVAMEKFLYWLETSMMADRSISERDAAVKLGQLRSEIAGYRGDSFETISAYGPGAALPHYVTPYVNAPMLEPRGLYLNDSGGQYEFGTTDITRTVPLGECTELEREDYTLVLKGHIDLAMAVFPKGTAGCQIDALAREPLWKAKRNFGHGTGHGVGFFLGAAVC